MVKRVAEAAGITEDQARTAIKAMREPTPEMNTKGWHAFQGIPGPYDRGSTDKDKVPRVWPAMIDAALTESD